MSDPSVPHPDSNQARPSRSGRPVGVEVLDTERFDTLAAAGGVRGIVESVLPTLAFIAILAFKPNVLILALVVSVGISLVAMAARLIARQPLTQVIWGVIFPLISAVWAWRSGNAGNFYAVGFLINALWLLICVASLLARWPVVGVFISAWRAYVSTSDSQDDSPQRVIPEGWASWREDPAQAALRRRYTVATVIVTALFVIRLVVEVPLYLAGDAGLPALGVARLVLGMPLFVVTLWFAWLVVRPARR